MGKPKDEIPASPLAPLMVQLLYETPPNIDFAELTTKVEKYCGRTDINTRPAAGADMAHYFMLDAQVEYKDGRRLPSQLCLTRATSPSNQDLLEKSLQQTWDWPEARQVVTSTASMLLANDFVAAGLEPKVRNRQFRGFIRAVQEVAPCKAMHWVNIQKVVDPARFVFEQDEEGAQPIYCSLNVRMFNIQGTNGDLLMDTLGLAVLGLPDIQCHFRNLPSGEIARVLYDVAFYIFENGDIIKDGETVAGIVETDHWRCQHEMALVGPERIVLDINPGHPYAAGNRKPAKS